MSYERPRVSILTGFLGSGKTTLLNRLLAHAEMADSAVIVNEFGDIGIDHALVETSSDGVVLLASGCVCCSVRGDLLQTLDALAEKRRSGKLAPFRRVLVETTGLADPVPILQGLITDYGTVSKYRAGAVITVIDAQNGSRTLDDRSEAVRQAALADRIVISKTDLSGASAAEALRERLAVLNPAAMCLVAVKGKIQPSQLLVDIGFDLSARTPAVRAWMEGPAHPAHEGNVRAHCFTWEAPLAWDWIANGLDALALRHGEQLLRVKGLVNVAGQETPVLVQGVREVFSAPASLPRWPDADRRTRLVIIAEGLERASIERAIAEGATHGVALTDA